MYCHLLNNRLSHDPLYTPQLDRSGGSSTSRISSIVKLVFYYIITFIVIVKSNLFGFPLLDEKKYTILTYTDNFPNSVARTDILWRGFFHPKLYTSEMEKFGFKPKKDKNVVFIDPNGGRGVCLGASVHFLEQSLTVNSENRNQHLEQEFAEGVPLKGVLYQNICESSEVDFLNTINQVANKYKENDYIEKIIAAIKDDPDIMIVSLLDMVPEEKKDLMHLYLILSLFKDHVKEQQDKELDLINFFKILNERGVILTDKQFDLVNDIFTWGLLAEQDEHKEEVIGSWVKVLRPIIAPRSDVSDGHKLALDLAHLEPDETFVAPELPAETFLADLDPDSLQDGHYLLRFETHDRWGEVNASHATALVIEGETCLFYDPNCYIISFKKEDMKEVLEYQFQFYHGHKPFSHFQQKLAWFHNWARRRANFPLSKDSNPNIQLYRVQLSTSHPSHPDYRWSDDLS